VFKRPQEVFLETEFGKLALLYELHGQLTQGIHREKCHVLHGTAPHLRKRDEQLRSSTLTPDHTGKKLSENLPRLFLSGPNSKIPQYALKKPLKEKSVQFCFTWFNWI